MNNNKWIYLAGILAVSLGHGTPAFSQGDPVVPSPPPVFEVPSVQQQPNFLQIIQQQQQFQNILNNVQFPSYLQANPTITPLDQRSGLVPKSIQVKSLVPMSLTITTVTIPNIANPILLAPTNTQVTNVNPPQTTSSINTRPSFSSLATLLNNLADLQNKTNTQPTTTSTPSINTPAKTNTNATTITILDTTSIKNFNMGTNTNTNTDTKNTTNTPTATTMPTTTKPQSTLNNLDATNTQNTQSTNKPATTSVPATTANNTNQNTTTTNSTTTPKLITTRDLERTPLAGRYGEIILELTTINVRIVNWTPQAIRDQQADEQAGIANSNMVIDGVRALITVETGKKNKLEAEARTLQDEARKNAPPSRGLPTVVIASSTEAIAQANKIAADLTDQLQVIDLLAGQIENLKAMRDGATNTTSDLGITQADYEKKLNSAIGLIKLIWDKTASSEPFMVERRNLILNKMRQSGDYDYFQKVLAAPKNI